MQLPTSITIALLVAFAAIFGTILWLMHQTEKRRQAGYRALADARGLEFTFQKSRGRQPARLRFSSDDGMTLEVTRAHSKKSGSTTTSVSGHSVLRLQDPRFQGGMAVYSAALADGTAAAASKLMGIFDNSIAKMVIGKLLGDDIGAHLGELQEFSAPGGVALTIMASTDPNPMFDAAAIARAIAAAPTGRNAESRTMVMLTGTGLQMRVGRDLNEAADISRLLDAGLALQADLRR